MQSLRARERTLLHEIQQVEDQLAAKKRELHATKQEIYALRDEEGKKFPLVKVFIFRLWDNPPIEYFTRNGHVFVDNSGKEWRRHELARKYPRPQDWYVTGEGFPDMIERLKKTWKPGQPFEPGCVQVSSSAN